MTMLNGTKNMKSALLVVDVQEDFCEPRGSLAIKGGRELVSIWNTLLKMPFDLKIATQDWHPANHISFASQHEGAQPFTSKATIPNPDNSEETFTTTLWPDHCVQNTPGAELIHELDQSQLHHIVKKGQDQRLESYSAFGPTYRNPTFGLTELGELLKKENITHVFAVGLAYGVCVKCTALDAAELGFKTYIIEDAASGGFDGAEGMIKLRSELNGKQVDVIGSEIPIDGKTSPWSTQLKEKFGLSA